MSGWFKESQSPQHESAEYDDVSDDDSDEDVGDDDGTLELPNDLVGQYVDLGKRRAALWATLLELVSQHLDLGSAADLDEDLREDLEEQLEELIIEAYEADR